MKWLSPFATALALCLTQSLLFGGTRTIDFTTLPDSWQTLNVDQGQMKFAVVSSSHIHSTGKELGGIVHRIQPRFYFADLSIGQARSFQTPFEWSGLVTVTRHSGFASCALVGFFNQNDTTPKAVPRQNMVGLQFSGAGLDHYRVSLALYLNDGPKTIVDAGIYKLNQVIRCSMRYDPNSSPTQLIARIDDHETVLTIDSKQRALGIELNAFGLTGGGARENEPEEAIELFIDDVTYTADEIPAETSKTIQPPKSSPTNTPRSYGRDRKNNRSEF